MCAVLVEWITIIPLFQFSVHIRNMICTEIGKYGLLGAKKSWCKAREAAAALLLLSTPPTLGGGRGGEGCSHPATHQIGRSTISNTSGNSLDLSFNVLRVVWRSVMQCCQWFAPPSCARLDCRHCTIKRHFLATFSDAWMDGHHLPPMSSLHCVFSPTSLLFVF